MANVLAGPTLCADVNVAGSGRLASMTCDSWPAGAVSVMTSESAPLTREISVRSVMLWRRPPVSSSKPFHSAWMKPPPFATKSTSANCPAVGMSWENVAPLRCITALNPLGLGFVPS